MQSVHNIRLYSLCGIKYKLTVLTRRTILPLQAGDKGVKATLRFRIAASFNVTRKMFGT